MTKYLLLGIVLFYVNVKIITNVLMISILILSCVLRTAAADSSD